MFRSSTIIRELALKLAKVIFILKHSVKLRSYLRCGCVTACHGMACVSTHAILLAVLQFMLAGMACVDTHATP